MTATTLLTLKSRETQFALRAVAEASRLAARIQRELTGGAVTKADSSPVTVADFAVQAVVAQRLVEDFPQDPLIGEEAADALRAADGAGLLDQVTSYVSSVIPGASTSQVCDWIDRGGNESSARFWTLDPIDGTKGFLRGEQFVIALALLIDGQVQLGVLGCPNVMPDGTAQVGGTGSILVAVAGGGAWVAPLANPESLQQIHVSDRTHASHARLLGSYESKHTNETAFNDLHARLGMTEPAIRMDSQAKYALVALGSGDVLTRFASAGPKPYREKIWDHAAGAIIVTEAGGQVTDQEGVPLDFSLGRSLSNNRGIVITNGHLHATTLDVVRQLIPAEG